MFYWFIGTQPASQGNKLVYAMQVTEVLPFEDYYHDSQFEKKKPVINGSWRQQCGDNMYYKDQTGRWRQHPSIYHCGPMQIAQDLKHPRVFIAERFYYFGEKAIAILENCKSLIWNRQGCKCKHDPNTISNFLNWLQKSFEIGIHGEPSDRRKAEGGI